MRPVGGVVRREGLGRGHPDDQREQNERVRVGFSNPFSLGQRPGNQLRPPHPDDSNRPILPRQVPQASKIPQRHDLQSAAPGADRTAAPVRSRGPKLISRSFASPGASARTTERASKPRIPSAPPRACFASCALVRQPSARGSQEMTRPLGRVVVHRVVPGSWRGLADAGSTPAGQSLEGTRGQVPSLTPMKRVVRRVSCVATGGVAYSSMRSSGSTSSPSTTSSRITFPVSSVTKTKRASSYSTKKRSGVSASNEIHSAGSPIE